MSFKEKYLHPLKMAWRDFQIKHFGAYRYLCIQSRQEEKQLGSHYKTGKGTKKVAPCVMFSCNGFMWHGGLADRLKGICSTYSWCKQKGWMFKINFCDPFILQDYLVPNEYNWLPEVLSYEGENVQPRVCMAEPRTGKYFTDCWDEVFSRWMGENIVNPQMQYHIYTNVALSNISFSGLFHQLFRPHPHLQSEIDYHKKAIGGSYISISFRFTTLLGDFTDCTGTPLPEDKRERLIETSLDAIAEISRKAPAHDRVLVTADSSTFLSRVVQLPNVYVIPGKVGHIDYDHGDDVNMKTFLDFLMISDAEAVYLAKGPGMYNSAFAKTAAMVNDRPFEVYEYDA